MGGGWREQRCKFWAFTQEAVAGMNECALCPSVAASVQPERHHNESIAETTDRRAMFAICSASVYRVGESRRTASSAYVACDASFSV